MMVKVTLLQSPYSYQVERAKRFLKVLRETRPDIDIVEVEPEQGKELMEKKNLHFGPAILINDRLEFVGIPNMRWFFARLGEVESGSGTEEGSEKSS